MEELIDGETVAEMLKGIDRYNPENLRILEPYVKQQVNRCEYDLSANLAVLKLYQFNPAFFQLDIVTSILMKALMTLPGPDFTLCECLIEQQRHEDPHVGRLIFLHHLLETCSFQLFWREVRATPELTEGLIGFEDAIRRFICSIVSITYQKIRAADLCSLLGDVDEYELERWIDSNSWSKIDDQLIFVANQEEIVKTRNIVDKVNFEKVRAVMSSSLSA